MEKQKKIYVITLSTISLLLLTAVILFAVKAVSLTFFLISFILLSILIAVNVLLLVKVLKKIKMLKLKKEDVKTVGDYNTDLYGLLGIPVQYNKDGSVKDIYELLGILPVFDENGKRVSTIYELLGIVPKFNERGEEIPFVFVIKNGVGKIAKVDVSSRVLTRKLTEEEKEALVIRETLKQKLAEAEKQGDKQKEESIKKILAQPKKKPAEKKSEYKPIKYTVGKGGKSVSFGKIDKVDKVNVDFSSLANLFARSAEKTKYNEEKNKAVKAPEPSRPEVHVIKKPEVLNKPVDNNKDKNPQAITLDVFTFKKNLTKNNVTIDINNEPEL